jgi:hypothetical protein
MGNHIRRLTMNETIEELVDVLIDKAQLEARIDPYLVNKLQVAADKVDAARTALLSRVSELDEECESLSIRLARAQVELVALSDANRWIPVSERLPEKEGAYYCWIPHSADIEFSNIRYFRWDKTWNDQYITHWRPLIDPPEVMK